jgi:hypothetical protein
MLFGGWVISIEKMGNGFERYRYPAGRSHIRFGHGGSPVYRTWWLRALRDNILPHIRLNGAVTIHTC